MSEVLETENFAYNAPQFCNLGTAIADDDPQAEEYFNFNHEQQIQAQYEDVSSDEESKQTFYTPLKLGSSIEVSSGASNFVKLDESIVPSNLRKSLSMGNLLLPPKTFPLHRPSSKDRLNMLAQPKPRITQIGFQSSAELINKFHQKTPKRFRTASAQSKARPSSAERNSEDKGPLGALMRGIGLTVPQSPALLTKSRSRPTLYMPKDVRDEQELEDMKKLKIKAKPVPKTNYGPAAVAKIDKKPATTAQPFNLTKIAPKKPLVHDSTYVEFHANPIRKSIFQRDLNETRMKPLKAIHTKPAPFSFQTRQEEMLKRRDQLITKVMEEEKKKREFHAQPIPKSVYKSPMKNGMRGAGSKENIGPSNNTSAKSSITNLTSANKTLFGNSNPADTTFKAKPANVLKKQPFIPKLNLLPPTAISAFNLNTERRVAEREAYEMKVREREDALAKIEQKRVQDEELEAKMSAALLRKQMEVKANPIRHFKPLMAVSPKPLTVPMTPNFAQKSKSVDE